MSTIDKSKMDKYVDGKLVEKGKGDKTAQRLNLQWWKASDEQMAQDIQDTVRFIEDHQMGRMEQLIASTRLYGNSNAFSLLGSSFQRSQASVNPLSGRISFNLCSSVIDTLTAKMAKEKIEPMFITNGGNWDIQLKAEQMSKFVGGCFYETDMHMKGVDAFTQSGAWGDGIVYIDEVHDRIFVEPAYPHEFFVDLIETLSGPPTQIHRKRIVERSTLAAQFEDEEDKKCIMEANPANLESFGAVGTAADLIVIIVSHHLPSDPDADDEKTDGRQAIVVGNKLLSAKPYTKSYFPYVMRKYQKRLVGYWGQSACERLQNMQGEINRLLILDQRSRWMQSTFKILIENGSKVVSQHLNNEIGAIIRYSGTKPEYVLPPAIDNSNEAKIQSLIAMGYRQEGVSELEAGSVKPMGVNSGKAMRTMANISDDRQLFKQQEQDRFYLQCAFQMVEKAKDISKRKKGSYKVSFPGSVFTEEIDWKNINLDKSEYVMKAFPASSLADDLAGRLSDIQEYMQAGLISPRAGRRLMRKPDLEMADKLADAPEDRLHKVFELMLMEKAEFTPPDPTMDFELAKELGLQYYNYAAYHGCPIERLNLIDKFLKLLDDLTGINQPPATPVPAASTQGVPEAPPVSDILPLKAAA